MGMNNGRTEEKERYNAYKRKLRVNDDCGLGRKLEKIEEFNESYFRDNYYDAFDLTRKILERNKKLKKKQEDESGNCSANIVQERLYNIITFCGGRGTGKTSVMDSVIGALQGDSYEYERFIREYEERDENKGKGNGKNTDLSQLLNEYEFICLDGIDASLLEGKEEILDVILSKMLQKMQHSISKKHERNCLWDMEDRRTYSRGDIFRKFEEICENRRKLLWRLENPYEPGESSAEQLNNLAGSLDIREKLQELITIYLQALGSDRKVDKKYLVINIDDLDIHGNAYQMLEQLHRYLMIPHVIIYIAVSEREIGAVCRQHFKETYDSPAEMAMSYLEKVLPYSRRIYLPATFSGDFFNIVVGEDPELDDFLVKDYLLKGIAQRTQVFYDGVGLETHFYEIGNLRTLFNFYYLLEGMGKIGEEDLLLKKADIFKKYREILNSNFDKLKNDVIGRMATEKLSSDEQFRIFREYYKEDFSSNGEYLIEQIIKVLGKEDFAGEYQIYGYSYGEILNALCTLGKVKQEFKPLIQCVLAMATIELTQNYIYAFYTSDRTSRVKWKEYISGSVCGNWANKMFPSIKAPNSAERHIAYAKNQIVNISIKTGIKKQCDQGNAQPTSQVYDICSTLIEENKLVESFELFMAFITKKSGNISMELQDKPMEIVSFTLSDWECTFDILGAVVNIIEYDGMDGIEYESYFKRIHSMLLNMFDEYFVAGGEKLTTDQRKIFEQKMEERSLKKAYEEWDETYGRIALPLYSMDIMYNVLKRVKRKMKKELPEIIGINDVLSVVKQFYKAISEELKEEDKFYSKGKEGERKSYTNFYESFCRCPFISPFMGSINEENTLPELFVEFFNGFIQKSASGMAVEERAE